MEERDQILIERYLANELTEAELRVLEQRKKDDPEFLKEFLEYELVRVAIRHHEDEELKKRFGRIDSELDQTRVNSSSKRHWFRWLGLLLFVILCVVAWSFYGSKKQQVDPVLPEHSDSTGIDKIPAGISDTSSTPLQREEPIEKTKEPQRQDNSDPEKSEQHLKGSEIFAENFEPYRDDMMDPTTRGESQSGPFDSFRKAYWNGRYAEVPILFRSMSPTQQENDNYRFQLANALLENGKTDEAIPVLESIVNNNRSRYVTESYFSLGMAYAERGEKEKAKEDLEKYLKSDKAKRKDIAEKVLRALNN